MKRPLSLLLSTIATAVFLIYEVHSPLALVLVICGIVARKQIGKLWDVIDGSQDSEHGWMYHHARAYAKRLHRERNPLKCEPCLRRL
jgi:hypothetical protein